MCAAKSVVWFKKDLRVTDHEPLLKSSVLGQSIAIFIVEETWLKSKDYSDKQLIFLQDCLKELHADLASLNIPFLVMRGDALHCIRRICS